MSEMIKLREIITIQKGKPPQSFDATAHSAIPYLSPEYLRDISGPTLAEPFPNSPMASEEDVILLWDGSNAGEAFRAKAGIVASTMAVVSPSSSIDRGYFFHMLKGKETHLKNQTNGTGIPHVDRHILEEICFRLPSRVEQTKIAEILDTLDAAIRGTEAVVAKLKAMKQGLLHDLLTRGIDANGDLRPPHTEAPQLYKETPLGWLPKEWDETTLGEIAEVDRGQFTHRPRNDPAYYGGRFPFIQTGDVAAAKGDFVTLSSQTLNAKGARVSREFPAGTIAITIAANIADTGILAVPMYFPDSVVGAVVNDGVNIRFVELWVRRAKRLLDARAPQSAQKNINLQDLRPLEVFLPEKDEQDEIGLRYDALFAKLNSEQKLLAKLRAQKSGLMDDLLTGRVSVSPLLEGEAAHGA